MTESSMPFQWHKTTLGAVALWGSGGTPSRKNPDYYGGNVPWVKTGDLGPKVLSAASEYITELGVQKSSAKYFPKGSVAIAMYGATIGKTSILGFDATTNQACAVGQPVEGITDTTFLYYLLRNEKDAFISKGKGGAQPNISQALIKEHPIALPPLAEQKVIADKLDTLLAQVENTKARLERVPQILKRFRQSVLAAAVSGRLTEEWRNGAEFEVESDALSKFVSIDIGHAFKSKEFTDRGISLLRGQNIEPGALRWSETKYFPEAKLSEFRHLFINSGDIVLAMDRPIISSGLKIARAKPSDLPCVLVQRVARFKDFNDLLPDYLYVLLQDISFSNYIQPNQTGSDIPHISGKQILAYPVEIPSIEEQTEIVRRVNQLFAHADRIEQQVNNGLARVNNLTQSILAKAFRGELTEQWRKDNPELITGENSAEALLERIKAERTAAAKPKRRKANA
ncbi:MAG: type I restriction endonuclease subunit S [Marinobacter sp.]|uniref:restriction endonuclease subunit S n=1 Tax=Spongiibacter sp. TaxID=2024860 RepID=UPI000C643A25|nr:restriction endonuclease subunit S [Spongiibacter sp.]MAH30559.1 type I restriction endonuclease subunit S [Marinobacter sp.]MAP31706.1 type I restriction endonuclease subunit S [Marinobacter sp.]MBU73724.1 type I restriction endonuclease subunit S [Spongiibacter sp.]HCP19661.1 type I restriction endonuclease subunit S [Marinobacter nauticus]|tara:strand:+ start:490 stop:1854 length:1365 start_codon:yes stop_codon:yes gene_type:complete